MRAVSWGRGLKLGLFAALAAALAWQVFHRGDWPDLRRALPWPPTPDQALRLLLVLALVPLNWGLEAEKWRRLMRPVERLSPGRALAATLSGVTLALFTPNRVGEYGGRVWYLRPEHRWPAVALSLVGSYAQLFVTLAVGAACGGVLYRRFAEALDWPPPGSPQAWLAGSALAAAVGLVAFWRLPAWAGKGLARRLPERFGRHAAVLARLRGADLAWALGLSVLRYATFTAQYLVLLGVFGVSPGPGAGILALGTVFLLQSLLPTLAAFEWIKRGNVALLVLALFPNRHPEPELAVLAASTGIWLVNLALPALAGYFLLLRRDLRPHAPDPNHPARRLPGPGAAAPPGGGAAERGPGG